VSEDDAGVPANAAVRPHQPRDRRRFGKPRSALTPEQIKEFEDFIMWRLVELSAHARTAVPDPHRAGAHPGIEPDAAGGPIEANPRTKFILFHGGYPWVGESAVIAMRHKNVWLDSCWLPTLSYDGETGVPRVAGSDAVKPDHVGADCNHAEGSTVRRRSRAAALRTCWLRKWIAAT
jgi:hypothetical protein